MIFLIYYDSLISKYIAGHSPLSAEKKLRNSMSGGRFGLYKNNYYSR
jgi:hypothetical protein